MLKELSIENIAIVKKECIEFDNGFSVLTGETGAGKSIIIDSIGLIMGARFSKELIRSGEENARVSALFTELTDHEKDFLENAGFPAEDDGTFFIQRKISVSGASSAIVNGRTVTVSILRTIGEFLINIHGQHASQALLEEENHILYLGKSVKVRCHVAFLGNAHYSADYVREILCVFVVFHNDKNRIVSCDASEHGISRECVDGGSRGVCHAGISFYNDYIFRILNGNDGFA